MYCIYSFQCNLRIIEKRARVWLRQILYMLELPSLIVGVYCNYCINGQTTNCATLTGRQLTHQCARESRHKYIPCPSAFRTRVHGSIMTHILRSPDTYITFLMTVFLVDLCPFLTISHLSNEICNLNYVADFFSVHKTEGTMIQTLFRLFDKKNIFFTMNLTFQIG